MRTCLSPEVSMLCALALLAFALPAASQTLLDLPGIAGDGLTSGLQAIGDFDADGFPDVLVGAHQVAKDHARPSYTQGGAGILSGRDWSLLFRVTGDDYQAQRGVKPGFGFGVETLMPGDLDGDGVGDVLVAHGSPKVLRKVAAFSGATAAFLFELGDPHGRTNYGTPMAALGDVLDPLGNPVPDGVPDFAIGAPVNPISLGPSTYPGRVYLYSGATPQSGPVVTLSGVYPRISFGMTLALAPDLDGDGVPALAVGSLIGTGVELFDGPGFGPVMFLLSPFQPAAAFGAVLANVGDLDGDGRDELAVAAPTASFGEGRVIVYRLDPSGETELVRLRPAVPTPDLGFGTVIAGLPRDPLSRRGLLDLDQDGQPDPFLDWNHDGVADFVIGASGYVTPNGASRAGGMFLVAGSAAPVVDAPRQVVHQGPGTLASYAFLPDLIPRQDEAFGWGDRIQLLGQAPGESQPRIAVGTPGDESSNGHLAVLRPAFAHFDDDTFSRASDVLGSQRELRLDFGPSYAGWIYYVLGTTAGAHPGLTVQGRTLPLNDDGPGGLFPRTVSLQAGGTPLYFSQLTGTLDGQGRAQVTLEVTGSTAGHPWFAGPRHDYLPVLADPARPNRLAVVGVPTPLYIE